MYVAFVQAVGNFGTNVQERSTLPPRAVAKFGISGNYIFSNLDDARRFKTNRRGYVALVSSQDLRSIIYELESQRVFLGNQAFVQQSEFRVRSNGDIFTIGALFHERPPSSDEMNACKWVKVLEKHELYSAVLKKENMVGSKLDAKNRIPWGTVSSIVDCAATARSMRTIVGTANKAFRMQRKEKMIQR